jgi:predicted nucleotidyltransferase
MLQKREKSSCQTGAVHTWQILLQKSKVASVRIFGEILKREAIDDSDNLSRVTEVANEFSVRR